VTVILEWFWLIMESVLFFKVDIQMVPPSIFLLESQLRSYTPKYSLLHNTYSITQHISLFHWMSSNYKTLIIIFISILFLFFYYYVP